MREVIPGQLWIGHAGDLADHRAIAGLDDLVIVDLAIDEPVRCIFRDRMYLRIPLIDGAENPPGRLRFAVETVSSLLREHAPTLVACSSGMSRSPAVAAFAIAVAHDCTLDQAMAMVRNTVGCDIAPALWAGLKVAVSVDQAR